LFLSLGLVFTLICSLLPVVNMLRVGEILKITYENSDDYDLFYEKQRKTALINFCLAAFPYFSAFSPSTS
jgi:hypothetical protein